MIKGLGIPYMGSKRKIAFEIVNLIISENPNCKYFYDLFGGGGAISFMALQYPQIKKVVYNELNTGVVELLKKIKTDGVTKDFYQWIDRETFNKHKNDNTWLGGLIKTCWSFGNNQSGYLFGKDIEEVKKTAHEYLLQNGYNGNTNHRIALIKQFKADKNIIGRFELERLQQLQQLERLQQLQQLERLERLEQLEILNLSYDQVEITTPINQTIIYLDPPYESTAKYQKSICHRQLEQYIKNSPYKIYLSSYECLDGLFEAYSIKHRSTLSATNNSKITYENLYCNQPENLKTQDLFSWNIAL